MSNENNQFDKNVADILAQLEVLTSNDDQNEQDRQAPEPNQLQLMEEKIKMLESANWNLSGELAAVYEDQSQTEEERMELIEINENLHKKIKDQEDAIKRFRKKISDDQQEMKRMRKELEEKTKILTQFGNLLGYQNQSGGPTDVLQPAPQAINPVQQIEPPAEPELCKNCGGDFHARWSQCPAWNNICEACNKQGHWKEICYTTNPHLRPPKKEDK